MPAGPLRRETSCAAAAPGVTLASLASAGGFGYEGFGIGPDARPVADAIGVPLCFGGLSPARNSTLTPFPLR